MSIDLEKLLLCQVIDLEERPVLLGEVVGSRLVILAFLRHFG